MARDGSRPKSDAISARALPAGGEVDRGRASCIHVQFREKHFACQRKSFGTTSALNVERAFFERAACNFLQRRCGSKGVTNAKCDRDRQQPTAGHSPLNMSR